MAAASNCLRLQSAFSCGLSRSSAHCQTPHWSNAGDSCNLGFARPSLTPAFGGVHSVYSGSSPRAHPCNQEDRLPSTFRVCKAGRQCRPLRNSHFLGSVNSLLQQGSRPTNQGSQSSRIVNEASTEVGEPKQRTKLLNPTSITVPLGDRTITIETGRMGRQANGAVMVTDGETVLYCTACADNRPCEPGDFAPFQVHYQERFSAAGRTTGGFIKREGRPRDNEVLISRLVDRPLRPMCAKGFNYETQVLVWVLSYDGVHSPEPLAILAAGAALAISDIPSTKPVAGVRVGMRGKVSGSIGLKLEFRILLENSSTIAENGTSFRPLQNCRELKLFSTALLMTQFSIHVNKGKPQMLYLDVLSAFRSVAMLSCCVPAEYVLSCLS
jgi:hypothetical protein